MIHDYPNQRSTFTSIVDYVYFAFKYNSLIAKRLYIIITFPLIYRREKFPVWFIQLDACHFIISHSLKNWVIWACNNVTTVIIRALRYAAAKLVNICLAAVLFVTCGKSNICAFRYIWITLQKNKQLRRWKCVENNKKNIKPSLIWISFSILWFDL